MSCSQPVDLPRIRHYVQRECLRFRLLCTMRMLFQEEFLCGRLNLRAGLRLLTQMPFRNFPRRCVIELRELAILSERRLRGQPTKVGTSFSSWNHLFRQYSSWAAPKAPSPSTMSFSALCQNWSRNTMSYIRWEPRI